MHIKHTPYTLLPYQDFILHHCVFIPYSHQHLLLLRYIIWLTPPPPPSPLLFFVYIMYHFTTPLRISFSLSQYLPLSIFPYSAFLLFMRTTCLFSSSIHIISSYPCYFQKLFPFLTTLPDEGLSPKRSIIKFFSKFTYFALGSLFS